LEGRTRSGAATTRNPCSHVRKRPSAGVGACLTIIGVLGFTGLTAVIAVEGWPSSHPPAERAIDHTRPQQVRQVVLGGATRPAATPSPSGTTTRQKR
jgi:hypothetical protein